MDDFLFVQIYPKTHKNVSLQSPQHIPTFQYKSPLCITNKLHYFHVKKYHNSKQNQSKHYTVKTGCIYKELLQFINSN